MPADAHEIVLPWASVMVIIVLLKDALTCATPEVMFLRSLRRTRVLSLAICQPPLIQLFLLARDSLGRSLAGARIGMRALAANRQAAPVAQAAITAQVHQPLDIHRHFAPQVALDHEVPVDDFSN